MINHLSQQSTRLWPHGVGSVCNRSEPGKPNRLQIGFTCFEIVSKTWWITVLVGVALLPHQTLGQPSALQMVRHQEAARIETVRRVLPSVVCVFDRLERGGGSGVLIDEEGYGLTNYHVVAGLLETRRGLGGLGDGVLYELEVLGIDITGDVAMFRLIPPKKPYRFPHAALGDSDLVRMGDTALVMGNPFTLSEDYSPTVTMGLVTGINRYQAGSGGNLTYTDCIQVDASVNPGNSGGPLFNESGQVIGINGRISINTRGRYNVGFGYAISTNQIKRFMPALRAGLLARHGTWQATVKNVSKGEVTFDQVRRLGPAYQAGVRVGDRLAALDGVRIRSANHVLSLIGTYPSDWPVLVRIERDQQLRELVVRLESIEPRMRRPFLVNRSVNERQIRRVIEQFQKTVRTNESTSWPEQWNWRVTRDHHPVGQHGFARDAQEFDVSIQAEGPVIMWERVEGELIERTIEYDEMQATQRVKSVGEATALPIEDQLVYAALYHMHRTLMTPLDDLDLTQLWHVGADAVVTPLPPESLEIRPPSERQRLDWPILEIIEWPLSGGAIARYEFDTLTHELVLIRIKDLLSGAETTIELSDHRDIGGLHWPTALEVHGQGFHYCDTMTDWELNK